MRKLTIGQKAVKSVTDSQGNGTRLNLHPKCILAGAWLRAAGFEIGDRVTVLIENGTLTISKEGA